MNKSTSPHDSATSTAIPAAGKPCHRLRYVLGLDVDLHFAVTAVQCGHGAIKPAQKLTRPQLLRWVREQTAAGHEVHTVYEACGFGYTLHEELTAAGARSLVTTPTRLSPERRRKNDRLDARDLEPSTEPRRTFRQVTLWPQGGTQLGAAGGAREGILR